MSEFILKVGGVDLSDYVTEGMSVTESPVFSDTQTLDEMYSEAEATVLFTAVSGKKIYDTPTGDPPSNTGNGFRRIKGKSVSISASMGDISENKAQELFSALDSAKAEGKITITYAAPNLTEAVFEYPSVTSSLTVDGKIRLYDLKFSANCPLIPFDNAPDADTGAHIGKKYTVAVGGNNYSEDFISGLTYSAAAPNHGMYGIASASFSCDIYTGAGNEQFILSLPPCSEVTFSEIKNTVFVLTAASFCSKGVVSITAYTKFVNADIIMQAETFLEKDSSGKLQTYSCQKVTASALSEIYDTGGNPASISDGPFLYVSEFKNKTVREILEEISKVNGGYFFENGGAPDFAVIGGNAKGSIQVSKDQYSECSPEQIKNVSRVFVTDSLNNNVYEIGSGEYYNTETLSGSYLMGETLCRQAASKLLGEYESWNCQNILCDNFTPILHTEIDFSGNKKTTENISVRYTKNHSVMSAGADSFQMNFADYSDQKQRALNSRVSVNKTYSNSGFNSDLGFYFTMQESDGGISPLSNSTAERRENYYFTAKSGGLTSYDGVMTSSKEAEKISVDKSSGTVTVTYSDGHIYKYSASVTENSTGYDITDEKEEWT